MGTKPLVSSGTLFTFETQNPENSRVSRHTFSTVAHPFLHSSSVYEVVGASHNKHKRNCLVNGDWVVYSFLSTGEESQNTCGMGSLIRALLLLSKGVDLGTNL